MRTSFPDSILVNNLKPYRAAIYARKSNDDRKGGQSNSVAEQIIDCLALIKREGWELVKDGRHDAYIDDGITGRAWPAGQAYEPQAAVDDLTNEVIKRQSKKRRLAFGRMLDDIKAGKIDVLVVRDLTRLARPVSHSLFAGFIPRFFLSQRTTRLYSIADGDIDFHDFSRGMMLMLTDATVDHELRIRAQHSKKALDAKRSAGYYVVGKDVFGLEVKTKGGEVLHTTDAPHVEAIFTKISKGVSISKIARDCYDAGLKTLKGENWSPTGIKKIVQNPIYAGLSRSPNGLVKCHQVKTPIISEGLYYTVLDIITRRKRISNRSVTSGGLASGITYCSHCKKRHFVLIGHGGNRYGCHNTSIMKCGTAINQGNLDAFLTAFYPLKPIVDAEKNKEYEVERAKLPMLREEAQEQQMQLENLAEALRKRKDLLPALDKLGQMKDELEKLQRKIAMIETLPRLERNYISTSIPTDADLSEKRQFVKDIFAKIIFHRHHAEFHLVSGESFTVKRTNGRHRWLHIPVLPKRKEPSWRFPNIRTILPLTGLTFHIYSQGLDQPVSVLGGKLRIEPSNEAPQFGPRKTGRPPKQGPGSEDKPEKAHQTRPFEDDVDF